MIQQMDLSKDRVIVEYGPGTGVFSTELLRQMTPGSHLILIETNEQFVSLLKQIDDERLTVIHGSAEDVTEILKDSGHTKADYILSGIPFSLMPADLRKRIMQRTKAALTPEGEFHVYQFGTHIVGSLSEVFDQVEHAHLWLNIPPLVACRAS